jgi:hypothetical protein
MARRRKKSTMKKILTYVGLFLGGVFAADHVKPILSKLPFVGGLLGGNSSDEGEE